MQVSSGLESPGRVLGKTLRTEDHPNSSQSPGSNLWVPTTLVAFLYGVFVLSLRAEHALNSYVLHFRPEAEIYVELSRLYIVLHL